MSLIGGMGTLSNLRKTTKQTHLTLSHNEGEQGRSKPRLVRVPKAGFDTGIRKTTKQTQNPLCRNKRVCNLEPHIPLCRFLSSACGCEPVAPNQKRAALLPPA